MSSISSKYGKAFAAAKTTSSLPRLPKGQYRVSLLDGYIYETRDRGDSFIFEVKIEETFEGDAMTGQKYSIYFGKNDSQMSNVKAALCAFEKVNQDAISPDVLDAYFRMGAEKPEGFEHGAFGEQAIVTVVKTIGKKTGNPYDKVTFSEA